MKAIWNDPVVAKSMASNRRGCVAFGQGVEDVAWMRIFLLVGAHLAAIGVGFALGIYMIQVGSIRTFENFMVAVPESVDPADYNAAIEWCETFGRFITAAAYQ